MTTLFAPLTAAAPSGGGGLSGFIPMAIVLVIFYAVVFYPMRKKQKAHTEMLGNLKNGDRVITNGGLYGTVAGMTDDTLQLRVADNVKVQIARSAVAGLQGEPREQR